MTQAVARPKAEKRTWIPEVPKKRIEELAERIKPVVRFASGENGLFKSSKGHLRYIKPSDPFKTAYAWDPKPAEKARSLKRLCLITTHHEYAYYGFFKPSVAEVLAQIPAEYVDKIVAFEIVEGPETADDLNKEHEALNAGYHVAKTQLYIRK